MVGSLHRLVRGEGDSAGYGNGKFGPGDTLTGDQFAKMLLCALELARSDNYVGYGGGWTEAVRSDAGKAGLYAGDSGMRTEKPILREQAALLAYNAVKAAETKQDPPAETKPEPGVETKPKPGESPLLPSIPAEPEPSGGSAGGTENPVIEIPGEDPDPTDPNPGGSGDTNEPAPGDTNEPTPGGTDDPLPGESGGNENPGTSDDGSILLPLVP